MNKTANFQLTQWEKTDRIMMEDFNRDNAAIDAALRRCGGGVYRLRLIHGYRGGTAIRDMLWTVYNKRSQVKRLVSISEGVTELVLREY